MRNEGSDRADAFEVAVAYDSDSSDQGARLLDRYGMRAVVKPMGAASADPNWVLFVQVASAVIFGSISMFLAGFLAEAGKDAYTRLREFLRDWRTSRGTPVGLVRLVERDRRLSVLIGDSLPDEALKALFQVELNRFEGQDPLTWDDAASEWRPRPYPQRRQDIVGWFSDRGSPPPVWHLTADEVSRPIVAICGASLANPSIERDPWCQASRI